MNDPDKPRRQAKTGEALDEIAGEGAARRPIHQATKIEWVYPEPPNINNWRGCWRRWIEKGSKR